MSQVPINLKVEESLLNQIDWCAGRAGMTRTGFVTELLNAVVEDRVVISEPEISSIMREKFFRVPKSDIAISIASLNKMFGARPSKGCWIRPGADPMQYPTIRVGENTYRAHRLSYMVFRQPIPFGWVVCHLCDTPGCISPDHLRLGTSDDNSKDRARKNACLDANRPKDPAEWSWPPVVQPPGPDPFPADAVKKYPYLQYPMNSYGERDVLVQLEQERKAFPAHFKEEK